MGKRKGLKIEKNMVCRMFKPPSHNSSARKQQISTALPPLLSKSRNHIKVYDSVKVARYVPDFYLIGF